MSIRTRICAASGALVMAYLAGLVCTNVADRVHQNVTAGDPTMLLGKYRIDGKLGYFVPGAVGLIAVLFLAAAIGVIWPILPKKGPRA